MHTCRGGVDGNSVVVSRQLAEGLFQLLIFRAGRNPSGIKNRFDCGKFFRTYRRARRKAENQTLYFL